MDRNQIENGKDEVAKDGAGELRRAADQMPARGAESSIRAYWREATRVVFDAHVRSVLATLAKTQARFLRGPGYGEPATLTAVGPNDADIQDVADFARQAEMRGRFQGEIAGRAKAEHERLVREVQELEAQKAAKAAKKTKKAKKRG